MTVQKRRTYSRRVAKIASTDSSRALDELAVTLARTDDPELIKEFLKSLLTRYEVGEISTRWALVRLIDEGQSQRSIARDLGLSLCKITRGSRELKKRNSAFQRMVDSYKEIASSAS